MRFFKSAYFDKIANEHLIIGIIVINLLFSVISFQFDALSFFLSNDICKGSTVIRLLKNKHDDATTIDIAYYIIVCDTESV